MEELTKEQVCVFIENEAQLEEARELLNKYEQRNELSREFDALPLELKFLRFLPNSNKPHWFNGWQGSMKQITLQELEQILKNG